MILPKFKIYIWNLNKDVKCTLLYSYLEFERDLLSENVNLGKVGVS